MKQIVITEQDNEVISLESDKGVKWSTFITGIGMLIETIMDNTEINMDIDNVLADVKIIYEGIKRINENN